MIVLVCEDRENRMNKWHDKGVTYQGCADKERDDVMIVTCDFID